MTEERKPFKDYFDRAAAKRLADQFSATWPDFDRRKFLRAAQKNLGELEMMERVRQWSEALRRCLPDDTTEMLTIVADSLPPLLPHGDGVTDGMLQWPLGQLIADHGTDDLDGAMHAMLELTQRFSSEFAVRPFVQREPETVFARLLALTDHESAHVRRWCSEGTRPRLPWGARLHALVADPTPILPILERLKDDPELYVRRSVANNLNDIAKDHPELVVKICKRWWSGASVERRRLVRHAMRTLIKAGNPGALAILGYRKPKGLSASLNMTPGTVAIGGRVRLELTLSNGARTKQALLVDYRVHYVKSNGGARPKVFKWKELTLAKGESRTLEKNQAMKVTTIRPLYAGRHVVDVLVNGVVLTEASFELG